MFEKGQEYKVRIEDISDQGQGIGHIDGFTVFVSGALPGDLVMAEAIVNARGDYHANRVWI